MSLSDQISKTSNIKRKKDGIVKEFFMAVVTEDHCLTFNTPRAFLKYSISLRSTPII
jgi:hypothetical protein